MDFSHNRTHPTGLVPSGSFPDFQSLCFSLSLFFVPTLNRMSGPPSFSGTISFPVDSSLLPVGDPGLLPGPNCRSGICLQVEVPLRRLIALEPLLGFGIYSSILTRKYKDPGSREKF